MFAYTPCSTSSRDGVGAAFQASRRVRSTAPATSDATAYAQKTANPTQSERSVLVSFAVWNTLFPADNGRYLEMSVFQGEGRKLTRIGKMSSSPTGNANVNKNMLEINELMGFRHAWSNTLWQLPLAEARTSLGLREAAKA